MTFLAPYFDEGLALAIALANLTSDHRRGAPAQQDTALVGVIVRVDDDTALRRLALRLREVLDQRSADAAAPLVNALLRDHRAAPELAADVNGRWHLHLHPHPASAETRDAVKAASGLAALLDADAWAVLRTCEATCCDDVFADHSRNQARRYCSRTCANRINAGHARARRRP